MLTISDLTFRIAGRTLFDGASASVPARAKVGFVGRNGTGKTTLFKLIQGELSSESGSIRLPNATRIGAVARSANAVTGTASAPHAVRPRVANRSNTDEP